MSKHPRAHTRPARSTRRGEIFRVLVLLLSSGLMALGASAQNLQTVACTNPNPGGNPPPIYQPFGIEEFQAGDNGTPMLRVTLPGVDSVCNDGTPAVIYVRPADTAYNGNYWDHPEDNAPANLASDRWIIWFHGGGGCRDEDSCLERWCSAPGTRDMDRAGKMSTLGAYDAIDGQGIFKRRSDNAFTAYNHVLLNYCSSDSWVGSDSKTGVVTSNGTSYDIEFQGEAIVNDAITSLLTGVTPDANLGFWEGSMPLLTDATEILFVGDSAGSNGLQHHVDRLVAALTPQLPAGAVFNAVFDAGFTPGLWRPSVNWASAPVASYFDYLLGPVADGHAFWGTDSTAVDASCLAPANAVLHASVGGSHPEICLDTTFALIHHTTTPFFVGMDINDTLARERYDNWGLLGAPPSFWAGQFAQLDDLATNGAVGFANPGVFGPKCDEHVRIVGGKFFTQQVVLPGGVPGLTYHDLLVDWLAGVAPSTEVQVDAIAGPMYSSSICP